VRKPFDAVGNDLRNTVTTLPKLPPPSLQMVGIDELTIAFDRTPWTIMNWVRNGQFPKPIYLNGDSGPARWRVTIIEDWLAKRQAKRHKRRHHGAVARQIEGRDG
jgi:hypothetical protein